MGVSLSSRNSTGRGSASKGPLWQELADGTFAQLTNANGELVGSPTLPDGSIGTAELANGALAASASGRAKMADSFFDAATATAKFAPSAISSALLSTGATSATATAGAATANGRRVRITTESLTTLSGSTYTLTLTNSSISASSIVRAQVIDGTNTDGGLLLKSSTPGSGSVVLVFVNVSSLDADGTFVIDIMVD